MPDLEGLLDDETSLKGTLDIPENKLEGILDSTELAGGLQRVDNPALPVFFTRDLLDQGVKNFTDLDDAPNGYEDQALKAIRVRQDETALEFFSIEVIQGERGEKGEKGDKGDKGDQGKQGKVGERGEKGDTGEKGVPGEKGERGSEGEQGERGIEGQKGEPGETGRQGEPGIQGEKGDKGDTGERGEKGERGQRGEKGETGEIGKPGETGLQGEKGERGEKGEEGPEGKSAYEVAVENGFVGSEREWLASLKGERGEQGSSGGSAGRGGGGGARGEKGEKGDKGDQGEQGIPGPPGSGGGTGDLTFVHTQLAPATVWTITHNLGKYPSTTIVDSGGEVVYGDVLHVDNTQLIASFSAGFSGRAFLN